MNLSSVAGNRSKRKDLLFFNFNQDASCFSAGTTEGVRVYNCDPFRLAFEYTEGGGCGIAEMLFCTSLVALVGSGDQPTFSPRKLRILNTATEQTICELPFVSSILAVKLNKKRMAVVMETKIHLYDISTMRILHTLDTATNSEGLVALSPDNRSHLAFPGTKGDVLLYDALNLASLNVIERAHKGSISFLAFNEEGTLLATASNKGTVVRVFAVPGGHKVCEFRRGSYAARIYSLAFSRDSSFLCVTSDTGTAHIYKIEKASLYVEHPQAQGATPAHPPPPS
ncbi:autophagy protein [Balamuthia mandrillaris]